MRTVISCRTSSTGDSRNWKYASVGAIQCLTMFSASSAVVRVRSHSSSQCNSIDISCINASNMDMREVRGISTT